MQIHPQGDGGADPQDGVDLHIVGVFFHIGQTHTGAEALGPDLIAGGAPALLHGLFHIGDAGTLIPQDNGDAVIIDLGIDLAAIGVDDHIDFALVHRDGDPADGIAGVAQLAQHALEVAAGFPSMDKVIAGDDVMILQCHGGPLYTPRRPAPYSRPLAVNMPRWVLMTAMPFSRARVRTSSAGVLPRTKMMQRISSISAVRMTCWLSSPVSSRDWPWP